MPTRKRLQPVARSHRVPQPFCPTQSRSTPVGLSTAQYKKAIAIGMAMLLAIVWVPSTVKAANAVGDNANGLAVSATVRVAGVPTSVNVPSAAPATMSSGGGDDSQSVVSVSVAVPSLMQVVSTGVIENTVSGSLTSSAQALCTSTVNSLDVLGGLVTADTVVSQATSNSNGVAATSEDTGTAISNLRINGVLQSGSYFSPNTSINISGTMRSVSVFVRVT